MAMILITGEHVHLVEGRQRDVEEVKTPLSTHLQPVPASVKRIHFLPHPPAMIVPRMPGGAAGGAAGGAVLAASDSPTVHY